MRLSRPCYDKAWRCPGWAGGGPKYAARKTCRSGHMIGFAELPHWRWRFLRCDQCDVVTWPYMTRYLSPWEIVDEITLWWRGRR